MNLHADRARMGGRINCHWQTINAFFSSYHLIPSLLNDYAVDCDDKVPSCGWKFMMF